MKTALAMVSVLAAFVAGQPADTLIEPTMSPVAISANLEALDPESNLPDAEEPLPPTEANSSLPVDGNATIPEDTL
jgi:hypothetical protein